MSKTTNYELYITDDDTEKFRDWRTKMGGETNSNMVKIDTVLGDKADRSTVVTATLASNGWSGVEPPFTQELAVEGLGATQNGTISVAHNATTLQREIAREAMLCVVGQGDGTLTIAADGELPTEDIPVYIIILG